MLSTHVADILEKSSFKSIRLCDLLLLFVVVRLKLYATDFLLLLLFPLHLDDDLEEICEQFFECFVLFAFLCLVFSISAMRFCRQNFLQIN